MLTRWFDWDNLDWARSFAELEALRREMNRVFGAEDPGGTARHTAGGFPRIGLFDTKEELVLRAELPGVAESDLEITAESGMLTLRGKRKIEVPKGYGVHRQERSDTTFARSFSLPCKVSADKAIATLKDGVLTLRLPKAPEVKPLQITVKTA